MASAWMFVGWLFFWRLSDKHWRKKILSYTVILNVIWYLLFLLAWNIWIFILSRTISWLAWAWISVAQAYISDISKPEERTKNMGLVWAMFWIWFIIWPAFGTIFSWYSLQFLWWIAASILAINALIIWFLLPESKKCIESAQKEESLNPVDFHHNKKQLVVLFFATFWTALWFSWNQSILPLFINDNFWIWEKEIWYVFTFIWIISVTYQVLFLNKVRWFVKERWLVIFWLLLLSAAFVAFSFNDNKYLLFLIIAMFPIAYWSINPWINSLIAKYAWNETWKAMWTNVSYMSIANIIWPIIAWFAYSHHHSTPYLISALFFIITLSIVINYIRK